MRFISANASGNTGAFLAQRLSGLTPVHALCSPEAALRMPEGCTKEIYGSTLDLSERMKKWVREHPDGVIVHSAAVGDYRTGTERSDEKIPSGQNQVTIQLTPTLKILDQIQHWSGTARIVSFKAAPPNTTGEALAQIGRKQHTRSKSRLVFANTIGNIEGDVLIIDETEETPFKKRSVALDDLSIRIIDLCKVP